jgi:hypothetical protein
MAETITIVFIAGKTVFIYKRTSASLRGASLGEKLSHPMEGIEHTYCNSNTVSPALPAGPTRAAPAGCCSSIGPWPLVVVRRGRGGGACCFVAIKEENERKNF